MATPNWIKRLEALEARESAKHYETYTERLAREKAEYDALSVQEKIERKRSLLESLRPLHANCTDPAEMAEFVHTSWTWSCRVLELDLQELEGTIEPEALTVARVAVEGWYQRWLEAHHARLGAASMRRTDSAPSVCRSPHRANVVPFRPRDESDKLADYRHNGREPTEPDFT